MKKRFLPILLGTILTIGACMGLFAACGKPKDTTEKYFKQDVIFYLDRTMGTAIGPLSTLCNPGTLTFKPDGKAVMNVTFTEAALIMMDNLLGFRIGDFVHNDTYELNADKTRMTYHPTRDSFKGEDIVINIEYLSDQSMKIVFNIGAVIPDTVLYFYSNEAMMPKDEPEVPETFDVSFDVGEGVVMEEGFTLPAKASYEEETVVTLPAAKFAKEGNAFRGWAPNGKIFNVGDKYLYQPGEEYSADSTVEFVAVWSDSFRVKVTKGEDGSGSVGDMVMPETLFNKYVYLPENPYSYKNYSKGFSCWQDEAGKTVYPGGSYKVTKDVTFTPVWNEFVNVTFKADAATAGSSYLQTVIRTPKNSKIELPEAELVLGTDAKKGFAGWKKEGAGSALKPGAEVTIAGDTAYVAVLDTMINVSFEADGGEGAVPAAFKVGKNLYFVLPECNLTKEGSIFNGWKDKTASASTSGSEPGSRKTLSKDTVYIPDWRIIRTLSFDLGEGVEGAVESVKQGEGLKVELPSTTATNGDKLFDGWTDGTKVYSADASYTIPKGTDTTLNAVWRALVEVKFEGGADSAGAVETVMGFETKQIELPQNGFTKVGYEFDAWTDGSKTYQPGEMFTVPVSGATIQAKWLKVEEITFAGGDGATGSVAAVKGTETKNIVLPANAFVKDGFAFGGWTDGTNIYEAGATYTVPSGGAQLSVNWMKAIVVKFVGGAGATGSMAATVGAETKAFVLPINNGLAKEGFAFGGWKNGDKVYAPGESFVLPAQATATEVTFTAVWIEGLYAPYTAIFRTEQAAISVASGLTLDKLMSMTELKLYPDLTADFVVKFVSDQYLPGHAATLGTTAEALRAKEINYIGIPYSYDAKTSTLTLKPEGKDPIVLTLSKKAKDVSVGRMFDQVVFSWNFEVGDLTTLEFAAYDGTPTYMNNTVFEAFKVKISILTVDIELTINPDGTGVMHTSSKLVGDLTFFHIFTEDYSTVLWLGDSGAFVQGTVGRTEDGRMTITVSMQGTSVTVTEKVA